MIRRLLLSRQAWRDLEAIEDYTIGKWGAVQAESYLRTINETLEMLRKHPHVGYSRPDIHESCRAYHVGTHIAVYRCTDALLEVLNILHPAMDFENRLKTTAPKNSNRAKPPPSAPGRN